MSLNSTPMANRLHIGFFGRRNAGKSSLVNAVTNQELAVVSDTKGTTTDPVYKSMELLPMGPVVIIDTPGFDDEGALGELRVRKTKQVLNKTDVAVLIVDATEGKKPCDEELIALFKKKEIPYIVAYNKADLLSQKGDNAVDLAEGVCPQGEKAADSPGRAEAARQSSGKEATSVAGVCSQGEKAIGKAGVCPQGEGVPEDGLYVSALKKEGIEELKEKIAHSVDTGDLKLQIVGDLINPSDFVILVVPIDKAAPKGRLILPQQQTIRDILEADAVSIVVKEIELRETLESLGKKPAMVITDSQVFAKVSADVPEDIPLTSFSILMARYKGFLETAVKGVAAIETLEDGDKVLIAEGCTHHRQCDDIGSVKIPRWLKNFTGKKIDIVTSSGTEFPDDLSPFKLIIHCGGCMLNEREVKYRMKCAIDQNIPFTNYGITIAYMQGILKRSVEIFPYLAEELEAF